MVDTWKSHPAVLAWFINDELIGKFIPALRDAYNYISAHDPDHPTWQVLNGGQDPSPYANSTDIIGIDDYPVMRQTTLKQDSPDIASFGRSSRKAADAVMNSRAIWMAPECSSIRYDGVHPSERPPTYEEIMCEAYQGIIGGARGLVFFGLYDLVKFDGEGQWQIVKKVGDDLYAISPIVLGETLTGKPSTASDNRISVLSRLVAGDTYILAVNPSHDRIKTQFASLGITGNGAVESGLPGQTKKTISVVNGMFTDTIDPLGTRVYKVVK